MSSENTARTSTRWGAREERTIAGFATVDFAQFVDMKLLAPQKIVLALYALTDIPIPGLTVDWILQLGVGSFNHIERFSLPVSDVALQTPLVLERPASSVLISAAVRSIIPETKVVRVVALIGPDSPTWVTDLSCKKEMVIE